MARLVESGRDRMGLFAPGARRGVHHSARRVASRTCRHAHAAAPHCTRPQRRTPSRALPRTKEMNYPQETNGKRPPDQTLTEMAMGYSRSRILSAAARLGIADQLLDEERSVDELATACGAHAPSLYRLLRALASFGIVSEQSPMRFLLTAKGASLRKDHPRSEWAAIVFWGDLIADSWSHLTECIRSGEKATQIMQREGTISRWSRDPLARSIVGTVMGTALAEDYMPIAQSWDFTHCTTVADLGGGGGALISAVLRAYPTVRGLLVDRPDVIEYARLRFQREGLAGQCEAQAGDICHEVPPGADVYMLKHVLHGYEDHAVITILERCHAVVAPTARILIIEFVLPDTVDRADTDLETRLMSDLNMLAVTGGKERSAFEWKELAGRAGLEITQIVPVPGNLASVIEAARKD